MVFPPLYTYPSIFFYFIYIEVGIRKRNMVHLVLNQHGIAPTFFSFMHKKKFNTFFKRCNSLCVQFCVGAFLCGCNSLSPRNTYCNNNIIFIIKRKRISWQNYKQSKEFVHFINISMSYQSHLLVIKFGFFHITYT